MYYVEQEARSMEHDTLFFRYLSWQDPYFDFKRNKITPT